MATLTDEQIRKIEETHEQVIKFGAILCGGNGDTGLCGEVKELRKDFKDAVGAINSRHHKLALRVWILVGVLAGGSLLTGSLLELFK